VKGRSVRVRKCHVLVVGAGPAGSSAALAAAGQGLRVLMVERRPVVGVPVRCAEYIPAPLMGEIDVGRDFMVQSVQGMKTILPDGEIKVMRAPGHTIRRDLFDQALARRAGEAGVETLLSTRVLSREGREVIVRERDGCLSGIITDMVIGADGPRSTVGRWVGARNLNLIPAVQARVGLVHETDFTEVYFHGDMYGGYGWVFPRGREANVGVGMRQRTPMAMPLKRAFDRFLTRLRKAGKIQGRPSGTTAGWIPAEAPRRMIYGNILLAGDAAGHTHPITGAGVAQAVISGKMAGGYAARAILKGDRSILSGYEAEWRDLFEETQTRAFERRQLLEENWDRLQDIIRFCWVGFREYYAGA